ncbi:MAG: hypothetical protein QOE15_1985 [Acidimicrobiaceae bacterium]|jgi:hypothetical protein|nr:hypothetical protein [Acidimicrobiaceae bacterium]
MSDITSFLSAWAAAERTRDVGVGPLGFELSKTAWLARHDGDTLKYETFVRPHGPVAIVTARQTAVGTFQGHPLPEVLRDTLLLSSARGTWQLAGIHMSFVAGTPGAPPGPTAPAAPR